MTSLIQEQYMQAYMQKRELDRFPSRTVHPLDDSIRLGDNESAARVGFIGPRAGMTTSQKHLLHELLYRLSVKELHHGDCIGADEQAHAISRFLGIDVVIHPPINEKLRASCASPFIEKPLPCLERNKQIVTRTDRLIAAPDTEKEVLWSSYTWAAVREARRQGKVVYVITPTGKVGN